jgi:excinuclease UvrABC helicase subunit UvrB
MNAKPILSTNKSIRKERTNLTDSVMGAKDVCLIHVVANVYGQLITSSGTLTGATNAYTILQ